MIGGFTKMLGMKKGKKAARMDTLIGHRSEVIGDIKFSGGLHVEGTVKGNIISEDNDTSLLQLSESGTIEGELKVPFIKINGLVVGDVHGNEHVELAPKARIIGNVYYALIEIAVGAEVNGKLVHIESLDSRTEIGHAEPDIGHISEL